MPIHPTALVHPTVRIDDSNDIGPGVTLAEDVEIGRGNRLLAGVHIGPGTRMGDENVIHFRAVIGHDPQDLDFNGGASRTVLGHRNQIRENVTIHRGTDAGSETIVGDDCLVMAGSHIAHNCRLGNGVILTNNAVLAGHVEMGDRAVIAGQSGVHQFARLGRLSFLCGLSGLSQDLPPFTMAAGRQATSVGLNTIGLKRAGLDSGTRLAIREAYRLIYRSGRTVPDAIAELAGHECPEVQELVAFIRESKRGIVGRPGKGQAHE